MLVALLLAAELVGLVPGPLGPLPDGWCALPKWGRDTWIGAYHDARSGAFVTFDCGKQYSADAWLKRGGQLTAHRKLGPATYRLVAAAEPRQRLVEYYRREVGPEFPRLGSWEEWMLPPAEAREHLAVPFFTGRRRWTFESAVCDDAQERRVRDLLLGAPRLLVGAIGEPMPDGGRIVAEQLRDLQPGADLQTVFGRLGLPGSSYRWACDGLRLMYRVEKPSGIALLLFGKNRMLVRVETTAEE
jgi:hypothetical protein